MCPIFAPFSQIGPKVWVRGGAGAAARESETHLDHDEGSSIFVEGERHDGLLVYPARNSLSRPLLLRLLSATPISVSLPLLLDFQTLRTEPSPPCPRKKKKKSVEISTDPVFVYEVQSTGRTTKYSVCEVKQTSDLLDLSIDFRSILDRSARECRECNVKICLTVFRERRSFFSFPVVKIGSPCGGVVLSKTEHCELRVVVVMDDKKRYRPKRCEQEKI